MSLANAEPNPITIKQLPSKVFVEGEEVSLSTYNKNKLSSSRDTILKYRDDYYVIDTRMLRGKENMFYECVKNDVGKMERNLNLGALVSLEKLINREGFIKKGEDFGRLFYEYIQSKEDDITSDSTNNES